MKQVTSFKELIVLPLETDRYTDKGNKVWWVNNEGRVFRLQLVTKKESGEFFWSTLLRWM